MIKIKYILSIVFGSACSLMASGQILSDGKFPPDAKVTKGMFDTYETGGAIYWSVPDSLLDREYSVTTTILSAPESPDRGSETKYGYAGDMIGPIYFSLHKKGNDVWMTDPQHKRIIADPASDFARIAMLNPQERIYKRFPVIHQGQGRTIIEIGNTLKNFTLFAMEPAYYDMKLSMRNKDRDSILEVRGKDDCILIRISRAYKNLAIPMPGKNTPSYEGLWETGVCVSLMPKYPISVKRGDGKSYFEIGKSVLASDGTLSRMPIIKRWRLEIRPEDRERYRRGELVEPVNPIIFYIDRNFPKMYRKSIIEAVREWRPAFEQAGFKNAIDAKLAPTPNEDPDFCMYDNHYAYISWKISGMSNAYGPTPCEGRSGEIMGCHVGVFSSVMDIVQNWYFAQCGASDAEARKTVLPESLQCELLKMVITHEIGHSLGLEHNHSGSSMASIDQLRDNEYLNKHGLGTSIMDYVRFNYALRPGDKVDLRNRRIQLGEYDRWAIEWGYREFEGDTPEEQEAARWKWYEQQKKARPELAFYDSRDIRSQQEDLGNDHVALNTCGIENLKYLSSLDIWTPKSLTEEQVMNGRFRALSDHYNLWTGHVFAHLGGYYYEDDFSAGMEAGKPRNPVRKVLDTPEYTQKVLKFIQDYVATPPEWLFDAKLTSALHLDRKKEIKRIRGQQMDHFDNALQRIGKVKDAEKDEAVVKSLEKLLDDVKALKEKTEAAYKDM